MNEQKQSRGESVAYRVAARMFESAFAAWERLPEAEQQLLLREIGKRVRQKISPPPPTEAAKPVQVLGIEIKQRSSEDGGSGRS